MIFITVGGQIPFDRLVRSMDDWAANHKHKPCFAQIGRGGWRPMHMQWVEFLPPPVFRKKLMTAEIVIAHAGMGTILSALEHGKKLVVVPRRGHLQETRNDHQVATAERFEAMGLVVHAPDETQLLTRLINPDAIESKKSSSTSASSQLLKAVRDFVLAPGADLHLKDKNGPTFK